MADLRARRPTLRDAMILVAAAALGMALSRPYLHWPAAVGRPRGAGPGYSHDVYLIRTWATALTPCLLAWTLVLPAVGRRHSGPGPRPRRTGSVVSAVTALVLAVSATSALLDELRSSSWHVHTFWDNYSFHALARLGELNGLGVAAGWMASALAGRRRSGPGWSDWLARLVGAAWVGLSILALWLVPLAELLG